MERGRGTQRQREREWEFGSRISLLFAIFSFAWKYIYDEKRFLYILFCRISEFRLAIVWTKSSKFHDSSQENLPTSCAKFMKFCQLHEIMQKLCKKVAYFVKICKNYEFLPNTWKYSKIMKFCQLHETMQKLWSFANFMKQCKNYEILPASWSYVCKNYDTC